MGIRGELFSTKVALQNRTYFFYFIENRLGDLYLNIVESKNREEGGFERQSVILFAEDLQDFLQGFDDALHVLEKAAREKRRETPGREQRSREQRNNEQRYKEPRSKDTRPNDRREWDHRNKEIRGNDFRRADNDRKPLPRPPSGRKPREDAYAGRPRRDANAGKQRWNDDSNRSHTRKRVVVKHKKQRTDE
jgi:hypothetical protein